MRRWSVVLFIPLLASPGCWSAGGAAPVAGPATQATERQLASTYRAGPPGIDDDSDYDPPSPVLDTALYPFREIGKGMGEMFAWPAQAIEKLNGDTPRHAVLQMEDKNSADNRRNGLNRLLEWEYTHQPPYTKVYEGMASLDDDPTVRAAAIRACNRSRDHKATPVFVKALSDPNELVRLEAAKGLANLPDPNATGPLTALANNPDESRDVRIAATDALKYYRTLEVARVLSGLLADRDFSICWQARRSLVFLTHQDFAYDQGEWLAYFVGPQKPLG
jgi:hypothetical protein